MVGDLLSPQVIYQGKSTRCLPTYKFSGNWSVIYTPKHWSNDKTMEECIKIMIIPYFESKRQKLKLEADKHGLLLFDNFNGQCTDGIFQLLEGHLINSVIIPVNCTDQLQPLNLSFNIAAKTFLCSKFQM